MIIFDENNKIQLFIDGRLVRLSAPGVFIAIDDCGTDGNTVLLVRDTHPRVLQRAEVDVFVYTSDGLLKTEYIGTVPALSGDASGLCTSHLFDFGLRPHLKSCDFTTHYFIELNSF